MFDTLDEAIGAAARIGSDESVRALEMMEPGPFLAIVLSGIDVERLSGGDKVTVARAHQRLVSHYTAELARDIASISDTYDEIEDLESAADSTATELRCALHLTRRSADDEVWFSQTLRDRLPNVLTSLRRGLIDRRRARVFVWETSHLNRDAASKVANHVIDRAPEMTTGQLGALLRRTCIEIAPELAARRYHETVKQRRVVLEPTTDGTSHLLGLDLPPDRAVAARRRIDALARSLREPGEDRTLDQLRADVFIDLLCGDTMGTTTGGGVELRVDLTTLAGLDESPGELRGYGPVIAEISRSVAARLTATPWVHVVFDEKRMPTATGTIRRRPTASQRRYVEAAFPTCLFPGCRVPASSCDLDHTIEWASGGRTEVANLGPLCRHDHTARHRGWEYRVDGSAVVWTSPLGRTYTSPVRGP